MRYHYAFGQHSLSAHQASQTQVIKLVMLRESYIKRLHKQLSNAKEINLSITGLFEVLRETTVDIVEAIVEWERSQMDYPLGITISLLFLCLLLLVVLLDTPYLICIRLVKPFLWNGANYFTKILEDLDFVNSFPYVNEWLRTSVSRNPFLLPLEALEDRFVIPDGSLLVFGERPPKGTLKKQERTKKPLFVKSPYLTPIVNDSDIIPSISALSKFKKSQALGSKRPQNNQEDEPSKIESDPFQTFLSSDMVRRIQKSWRIVVKVYENTCTLDEGSARSFTGSAAQALRALRDDAGLGHASNNDAKFSASFSSETAAHIGALTAGSPQGSYFPNASLDSSTVRLLT